MVSVFALLAACSSDSNSSSAPQISGDENPALSSGEEMPALSSTSEETGNGVPGDVSPTPENPADPSLSSSSEVGASWLPLTEDVILQERAFIAAGTDTALVDLQTVYQNLASDEKLVLILRHGKRQNSVGVESELVADGIAQAKTVGEKLKSDEPAFYGHTGFLRTMQTAQYIAEGRGQVDVPMIEIPELVAGSFVKDAALKDQYTAELGNEGQVYSSWAFDGLYEDAFYDLEERCIQVMTQKVIPSMSPDYRLNVFISHDMFIGPFVIYYTDRRVARLQYHVTKKWIYNLDGLAVVVKSNGERRYIPVFGVDHL